MKKYYKLELGIDRGNGKNSYAKECLDNESIGLKIFKGIDLNSHTQKCNSYECFRDVHLGLDPTHEASEVFYMYGSDPYYVAWLVSKDINVGDIILLSDGLRNFIVGKVCSKYIYNSNSIFPHQRKVTWFPGLIELNSMSYKLGRVCHLHYNETRRDRQSNINITKYSEELDALISGKKSSGKREVNPGFAKATKATVTAKEHNTKVLIEALEEYRLTKGISKEILKKEKLKTILPGHSGATTPFYEGLLPSFEKVFHSKKKRFNKPTATTLRNNLTKTDYFT